MRILIIAGLCLSAVLIPAVSKSEPQDGSFFLEACGAAVRVSDGESPKSGSDLIGSTFCTGYVAGFLDGMSVTSNALKAQRPICLPENGISNDQAIRIFVKYLRQNPEVLNQSGRVSLLIALRKVFPCT